MTTPIAVTRGEVLVVIKKKEFVQHLSSIKSGTNTRYHNNFLPFYHGHDIKECYALKYKMERLIIKDHIQ
jgi:hypothetical protein